MILEPPSGPSILSHPRFVTVAAVAACPSDGRHPPARAASSAQARSPAADPPGSRPDTLREHVMDRRAALTAAMRGLLPRRWSRCRSQIWIICVRCGRRRVTLALGDRQTRRRLARHNPHAALTRVALVIASCMTAYALRWRFVNRVGLLRHGHVAPAWPTPSVTRTGPGP